MSSTETPAPEKTKRPPNTPLWQQRLPAWQPILTPYAVVALFWGFGLLFVILGAVIVSASSDLIEHKIQYDGSGTPSSNSACRMKNAGSCDVTFDIDEKMEGPVYVYYQIENFFQNHRRYVKSYSSEQLQDGKVFSSAPSDCAPLKYNGSLVLMPCGLIANSLFNDKIELSSGASMSTTGIAWPSDKKYKFSQPSGFEYVSSSNAVVGSCLDSVCDDATCETAFGTTGYSGCKGYHCDEPDYYNCESGYYAYYYPDQDSQQYLYQTFPEVVSPLEGVKNEHFIVWMRTAALATFRKLYGKINSNIAKGTTLTFSINANFAVDRFEGKKWLVIAETNWFGGKNPFLGNCFIVVGSLCLAIGGALLGKLIYMGPRKLGDTSFLE